MGRAGRRAPEGRDAQMPPVQHYDDMAEEAGDLEAHIGALAKMSDNQRLINNLSYATALTARHWLSARKRVLSLVPESQAPTTKTALASLVLSALAGSVTVASGGLAMLPLLGIVTIAAISTETFGAIAGGASAGLYLAKGVIPRLRAADSLVDPFEFFLDCELSLRRFAAMSSVESSKIMTQQLQVGSLKLNFAELKGERQWAFLFAKPKDHDASDMIGEHWRVASEVIEAQMRRLAWRYYCRSLWGTDKFQAKLDTTYRELQPPNHWMDPQGQGREWYPSSWKKEPPETWPYKVWQPKDRNALIHTIMSDFQGPEHFPNHKCNRPEFAGKDLRDRAKLMQDRMSWISHAVIQCCKIETPNGTVDFEGDVTLAGSNGNAVLSRDKVPEDLSVDVLRRYILKETSQDPEATQDQKKKDQRQIQERLLKLYGSKGVPNIRIVAARVSDKVTVFGNTGKKGTIRAGYDGDLNRLISVSDVTMPNVPERGSIEFVLASAGTSVIQSISLQINRCVESGGQLQLDVPTVQTGRALDDEGILVSGHFVVTSSKKITCLTEGMSPGVYAVRLKSTRDIGQLSSNDIVYFDESVWFFRVTPASNLDDELGDLRWALAWIYGRTLELLKQHDSEELNIHQMIAGAHALVSDELPGRQGELDRSDFFCLRPDQLAIVIMVMNNLMNSLVRCDPFKARGSSAKGGVAKNDEAKDSARYERLEVERFMAAVKSMEWFECLDNIQSDLSAENQPSKESIAKLETMFRVISEGDYKKAPQKATKKVQDSEVPGPVYYGRVR